MYYLTQVGRGGACPGTFFANFNPERKVDERIRRVSEQLTCELTETEWEELYGDGDWEGDREDGTISLCGMDLTYDAYLIVTGSQWSG